MNDKLMRIKYLIIDVDGTMTDGGIYYDENGNEIKKFSVKDAAGFFAAHCAGIKIVVITGRECLATSRRLEELKVSEYVQNVKNKFDYLRSYIRSNGICREELGYIGDDLNDFKAMTLAAFVACPFDSCQEVRDLAEYVSSKRGGEGAVRDVIEYLLRQREEWDSIIDKVYS